MWVCVSVRVLKRKRLELSTSNFVYIHSIAVPGYALTLESKHQRSSSRGYQVRCRRSMQVLQVDMIALVSRLSFRLAFQPRSTMRAVSKVLIYSCDFEL